MRKDCRELHRELMGDLGIRGKISDVRYQLRALMNLYAHVLPADVAFDFQGLESALQGAERYASLLADWALALMEEEEK